MRPDKNSRMPTTRADDRPGGTMNSARHAWRNSLRPGRADCAAAGRMRDPSAGVRIPEGGLQRTHPSRANAPGRQLAAASAAHAGLSGFRLLPVGIDSFLLRMEMAQQAERTLDIQYFVIENDDTGKLIQEALLQAADRGVRVRVLLDDEGSRGRTSQADAAGCAPEHRVARVQPGDLPGPGRAPPRRRVAGRSDPAELPDAQQAVCRRQRDRHHRRAQYRRCVLPGRTRPGIRRLRRHRRRRHRQGHVGELRCLLEQPTGHSDRGAVRRQGIGAGAGRLSRRAGAAPCTA